MKLGAWIGILFLVTLAILSIGSVTLEMTRPGKILCPLRRILEKKDIDLDDYLPEFIEEVTSEEEQLVEERAKAYREEALRRFPNLRVEARDVPLEENGYWQLFQLGEHPVQPTTDLTDVMSGKEWENLDLKKARELLAKNGVWVKHIEGITRLSARSNTGLPIPEGESHLGPLMRLGRYGFQSILLKSWVEASEGQTSDSLKTIRSLRSLLHHLVETEAPSIVTVLVSMTYEQTKNEFVLERLLPAIGPGANLEAWKEQLWQIDLRPGQISQVSRGDWNNMTKDGTIGLLWTAHYQHKLTDPDETAFVLAEVYSKVVANPDDCQDWFLDEPKIKLASFLDLSPDGQAFVEEAMWFRFWPRKMKELERQKAFYETAFQLLALERERGSLAAADTAALPHDPITGKPFPYDPKSGVLSCPNDPSREFRAKKITLPWRDQASAFPSNPPQE